MRHISILFIYHITKFFVQGNQHTTNRVSIAIVISWWRKRKQFHQSEWFSFLFCPIAYHWCVTVYSIPTLPNQYVVIANAISSNQIVIYWQLTIVGRNYRHITDASVGTNKRRIGLRRLISAHCGCISLLPYLLCSLPTICDCSHVTD